jgi:hypothetical protein
MFGSKDCTRKIQLDRERFERLSSAFYAVLEDRFV